MSTDIHASISRFLQQQTVTSLAPGHMESSQDYFTKAGVVPFQRGKTYQFYVMRPHGVFPQLGPPPLQLCKGTRQYFDNTLWQDMRAGWIFSEHTETLAQTALREGIEELGLKLQNIAALFDMGGYRFSSATTGKDKQMWLLAAEIFNARDFLPKEATSATTESHAWMSAEQFSANGRVDHRHILTDIEAKLRTHYRD